MLIKPILVKEPLVNGKSLFDRWFGCLDKMHQGQVLARLDRVKAGNLGPHRNLRYRMLELKFISGLRIYAGWQGDILLLLMLGGGKSGGKRNQDKDIRLAEEIWIAYTKGNEK